MILVLAIGETLLQEFDREVPLTRRLLERVPDAPDWRPHPRAMSIGELAAHVADLLDYSRNLLDAPGYDLLSATGVRRVYADRAALLAAFDAAAARARAALAARTDAALLERWRFLRGTEEIFSAPRSLVFRRFLLNHLVHHRAQLGVYLR
ncbi:MAG TPA: DinB family protein, partial [Vicinamibacterales bacterium]